MSAAPKAIYVELAKRLNSFVQKRLRRSLELNLTKDPKLDLLYQLLVFIGKTKY
jgi:hypothetical protein